MVVSINPEFHSMRLVQTTLSVSCPWNFTNTSLDPALFHYDNLTIQSLSVFYKCPRHVSSPSNITCKSGVAFFARQDETHKLQIFSESKAHNQILVQGEIPDVVDKDGLNKSVRNGHWNWKEKLIAGAAASFSVIALSTAFYFYLRQKKNRHAKSDKQSRQSRTISSDSSINDAENKERKYFGVHLFSYTELEEATNNFDSANELGDGGFGTVYRGLSGQPLFYTGFEFVMLPFFQCSLSCFSIKISIKNGLRC
ncbi:hypothetical protein K1719_014961 [Acacia pycnantha]|nr:hypothetical protein K1719_014961 [Acacia pycnantha]